MSALEVIERSAKRHGVTVKEIKSQSRHIRVNKARQDAMLWLRVLCKMTYEDIAKMLGRTDHTTIIHGAERAFAALPCKGQA